MSDTATRKSVFSSSASSTDDAAQAAETALVAAWGDVTTASTAFAAVTTLAGYSAACDALSAALAEVERRTRVHLDLVRRSFAQACNQAELLHHSGADLS